jgi:hypothetical protein
MLPLACLSRPLPVPLWAACGGASCDRVLRRHRLAGLERRSPGPSALCYLGACTKSQGRWCRVVVSGRPAPRPSMRTSARVADAGRSGRSGAVDRRSSPAAADGVAVLSCCTASGCDRLLRNMTWLCRSVSHLGSAVPSVHRVTSVARLVGVGRGCHPERWSTLQGEGRDALIIQNPRLPALAASH